MKLQNYYPLAGLLLGPVFLLAQNGTQPSYIIDRPTATVFPLSQAPVIDGEVTDDPVWKGI
ncbi:MAG: hypothetical protein ACE5FF_02335, partial [Saprospiraceae bacterium]